MRDMWLFGGIERVAKKRFVVALIGAVGERRDQTTLQGFLSLWLIFDHFQDYSSESRLNSLEEEVCVWGLPPSHLHFVIPKGGGGVGGLPPPPTSPSFRQVITKNH